MATIHIMTGYVAFGKSTLARRLSTELPAVKFNIDEIIAEFYGTKDTSKDEFMKHVDTAFDFVWDLTAQIINVGSDVILDFGPWSAQQRADVNQKAKSLTPNVIFHEVIIEPKKARERLVRRNKEKTKQGNCSLDFFDKHLSEYAPISDDEKLNVKRYFQE